MNRSFYVKNELDAHHQPAARVLTSPHTARTQCADLPNGRYAIRDCLGGLRMRIAVQDGAVSILEQTA